MTKGAKTLIFPVRDLDTAKRLYGALLATAPHTDQPYYVGYSVDGQEVGLDPNGFEDGMANPVAYWHVDDIEALIDALVSSGATVTRPLRDVGGGRRVVTLSDADGNPIGLLQDA